MQRNKVFNNLFWRFLERSGAQGVTLIVSVVLARIIDPTIFGTISLITVFTAILQVFVDSGLGNALIQKKNADDIDFSSVFYFNMALCSCLYVLMFLSAPLIASFYRNNELVVLIRVMSLILIISGLKNIQQAYVSRHMLFKKFFYATLGGTIGSAILGIWMAYHGYEVWALVAQNLFNQAIGTIILWVTVKWRPKLCFSWNRFKNLYSYAWKLLVSSLMDTFYQKVRQLLIGKYYSTADLAYYNLGQQIPYAVINNINTSIDSVLLPVISIEQENIDRVKSMTRRSIKIGTYIISPMMIGIACIAEPLVRLCLTEKWLPCVFFLRIFCITFMFRPINTSNISAIKALGRSDIVLKLEILKKALGFIILFGTIWFGVEIIALGLLLSSIVTQIVNAWPNNKLLNYHYFEQLKDIIPNVLLSVIMGVIVYCISLIDLNDYITIIFQVLIGIAIYIGGSILCKMESFYYVLNIVKGLLNHMKEKNG
jgi:O-antigen/teichoic acid export membrane protein